MILNTPNLCQFVNGVLHVLYLFFCLSGSCTTVWFWPTKLGLYRIGYGVGLELDSGTDRPRAIPWSPGAWGPDRDGAGPPCPDLPDLWPSGVKKLSILQSWEKQICK